MSDTGWIGIKVRKGESYGVVINDYNSWNRVLSVKMDNGTRDEIVMNNTGPDDPKVHEWEWFCVTREYERWYRF